MRLLARPLLAAAVAVVVAGSALAAVSTSGVRQIWVHIKPDPATGLTYEQSGVKDRLINDNKPGAVKHLYVFAPRSGQILLYSTVQGKVTSGSKRITSSQTIGYYKCGDSTCFGGFTIKLPSGRDAHTKEVLGDDGTYGSSTPYIYWWDAHGRYHQHFVTDEQVIQVTDQPIVGARIIINAEVSDAAKK